MEEIIKLDLETVNRVSSVLSNPYADGKSLLKRFSFHNTDMFTSGVVDFISISANKIVEKEMGYKDYNKLSLFVKEPGFIHNWSVFVDTISILLLNKCTNIDFKDIVYLKEDEEFMYFKTIPRI